MSAPRALSLIALVLALTAASVTMATTRHQQHAVGELVICTGDGIVVIGVDADGQPNGLQAACPDCIPPIAALPGEGGAEPGAVLELVPQAHALRDLPAPASAPRVFHRPRGPPGRV